MLIKQHEFRLYRGQKVLSFVVEELIWSEERRWPDKFRLTVQSPFFQERTFYGPIPEQLVDDAIRYINRREVHVLRSRPSLHQVQTGSGTNGRGD
jgi:hypothetical protein